MVDRRGVLLATVGMATVSGCSNTGGGGEDDTGISLPSCSSSNRFKLVDSSYDPIPSRVNIGVELRAFENIGNQPVYEVDVEMHWGDDNYKFVSDTMAASIQ